MRKLRCAWQIVAAISLLLTTGAFAQTSTLPVDIRKDAYLTGLAEALKVKDFTTSLSFIKKLRNLQIELPPTLDYFEAEANCQLKNYARCEDAAIRYVTTTGATGRYYDSALKLIVLAEPFSKQKRAAETKKKQQAKLRQKCGTAPTYQGKSYTSEAAVSKLSAAVIAASKRKIAGNSNTCYKAKSGFENQRATAEICRSKSFNAKKKCEKRASDIGERAYRNKLKCQGKGWEAAVKKGANQKLDKLAVLRRNVRDFNACMNGNKPGPTASQSRKAIEGLMGKMAPSFLPKGKCALIVASRKTKAEIKPYISKFPNAKKWYWTVYEASNGWLAISAGLLEDKTSKKNIARFKNKGVIPGDSYCASGKKFLRRVSY